MVKKDEKDNGRYDLDPKPIDYHEKIQAELAKIKEWLRQGRPPMYERD